MSIHQTYKAQFKKLGWAWCLLLFAAVIPLELWAEQENDSGKIPAVELRVRSIKIEIREIFDETGIGAFYRGVNKLKIQTKEEVVRRELMLREGDVFNEFLVEESERNLRALPFLRQVSIIPLYDGNVVDLLVSVQDTWTLYPFINWSSGSGTDKKGIGIAESNVFGYGKRLEFLAAKDEGRDKIEGVWDDRRFLGTYHQLSAGHFQRSDGYRTVGTIGRPFRSFADSYAWSVNGDSFDLVGRLFKGGEERYIFRQRHNAFTTGYTWSLGEPEEELHRYTVGYDYTRDEFIEADEEDFEDVNVDPSSVSRDPELLPADREFSGPLFSFQRLERDFLSINFVDRFERVEDFNLGNDFTLSAQIAPEALGSIRDTLLVKSYISDGWRPTPTSFLRGELRGSVRSDDDGLSNVLAGVDLKYFNVLGAVLPRGIYLGKHTLASAFSIDYGDDFDKDYELVLGASNGLRGYSDRTFVGSQRMVLNLEDRFHVVEDVLRLFNIGGAVFFDGGGTTYHGLGDLISDNLYGDVGFGLRIGLTRSSGGAVIRIDVAFPLRNGPDGSSEFEPRLLISTGQYFSARLRSEALSSQAARVSAGFLP